ncbi:MAG: DUF4859 domain-containing protein [Bacteroidaceae bacterium]|jgi:hypothetical protein
MNRKLHMISAATFVAALCMTAAPPLQAQETATDITENYLQNADFETAPTGIVDDRVIYDVPGWEETPAAGTADTYCKLGTIPYGEQNGVLAITPENGTSVTEGNATVLAIKEHWDGGALYVGQTVELPAGTYRLSFDTYQALALTSADSRCGYVIDGVETYAPLPETLNEWKQNSMTFTLTAAKEVEFRMGYTKTENTGGDKSPILLVDNVKLESIAVPEFTYAWTGSQTLLADAVQNSNFADESAWTGIGAVSDNETEYYQTGFDLNQQITGLEAGLYIVKAQAFQRTGWNDGGAAYEAGTETITSEIYAASGEEEVTVPFASLYSNTLYPGWDAYPDNMAQAAYSFGLGLYEVATPAIRVGEDGTITVGARESTSSAAGRWSILTNVRLYKVDELATTEEISAFIESSKPHSLSSEKALNTALSALQEAIIGEAADSVKTQAAEQVQAAIDALNASADEFADYAETIEQMKEDAAQYAEIAGYQAYLSALDKAYDAYTGKSDDLAAALAAAQAAEKTCILTGTDYTGLIENPSFEALPVDRAAVIPGWTKTGQENSEFCTRNDEAGRIPTYGEGNVYFQHWVPNTLPDISLTQTLTEIPNGKYRVTAAGSFSAEGFYLIADDSQTAIDSTGDFTAETLVTNNTLTIGVKTEGCTGNWVRADNFRLTYLGDPNAAPTEPSTAIDESGIYYIYNPAADKFMTSTEAGDNGALYSMESLEDNDAYKWEITLTPGADESEPATVTLKQLSSGKYLNALTTNTWSMGLGEYDATGSHYIVNDGEGTYTLSNLRNTNKVIGFDNLNDGSTPYYDKSTSNNPYFKFYKVDEYEAYLPLLPYYEQKEALRERINTMRDLKDGILGGYHSEEDEEGLASILSLALEVYEQPEANVAIDSVKAVVTMADNAIEVYQYSTMATKDNPANFTFAIANADGEQASWHSIPGWTMEPDVIGNWGSKEVTNEVLTGNSIELWNPGGTPFTVSLTQSLAGLPNGVYSLDFGAFAADQSNSETVGELYFFAGSRKAAIQVSNPAGTDDEVVGAAQQYSIENIYVLDGTLDLGIRAEGSNSNWFGFDNVTLTYYGPKETLLVLTDSVTRSTEAGYDPTYVDNHSAEVCAFLGVDSLADEAIKISVITPEGQPVENTTDGWFGADGNLQAWGSDARVCVKYPADQFVLTEPEYFICTMPDVCQDGDVYTTQWGVMTATDTVIIRTVVTMVAPEIPDITKPEQCTNLGTVQITAEAEADATGANSQEVSLDVEEIAAFFEMDAATFSETTAFYATARDTFTLKPTANQGGYWLDANGEAISWGEGATFFIEPVTAKDYSLFRIGQYGGACAAGDEYKANLYFVIGDEMVTVELTYTITGEATGIDEISGGAEVVSTEYYTLDGIQIDAPTEGIYIVTETYSDGTVKTYKKFVK